MIHEATPPARRKLLHRVLRQRTACLRQRIRPFRRVDVAVRVHRDAFARILRNGSVTIGLFQGVWERNLLTFNPGWDEKAQAVVPFTDVREHQRRLKAKGLKLTNEADERGTGPASFMVIDPDGNPVLFDQHAPSR